MGISKLEWETTKRRFSFKCAMCGRTEKTVGILERGHIKARSKGGSQVIPLCPTCHKKYDSGKATDRELGKIGVNREDYDRLRPERKKKKDSFWWH